MTPIDILEKSVEYFNNADVEAIGDLYAEDVFNHQVANAPVIGRAAIKDIFEVEFFAADMVCIVEK